MPIIPGDPTSDDGSFASGRRSAALMAPAKPTGFSPGARRCVGARQIFLVDMNCRRSGADREDHVGKPRRRSIARPRWSSHQRGTRCVVEKPLRRLFLAQGRVVIPRYSRQNVPSMSVIDLAKRFPLRSAGRA